METGNFRAQRGRLYVNKGEKEGGALQPGQFLYWVRAEFFHPLRTLLTSTGRIIARRRYAFLALTLTLGLAALLVHRFDQAWYQWLGRTDGTRLFRLAQRVSLWGDIHTGWLLAAAALWGAGFLLKRPRWRQAALACMLAAALAGVSTYLLRPTTGRPRPFTNLPDGFYGPQIRYQMNSFPSGHTATAFGSATALAVALPAAALPALAAAGAVGWARLYTRRHWPSDVLVGAALGLLAGIPVGLAARRED